MKYRSAALLERALELYHFDQERGIFFKLSRDLDGNPLRTGDPAGLRVPSGIRLTVDKDYLMAHHLAWRILRGSWSHYKISHKNGDPTDNRPDNIECKKADQEREKEIQRFLNSIGITQRVREDLSLEKVRERDGERAYIIALHWMGRISKEEKELRLRDCKVM